MEALGPGPRWRHVAALSGMQLHNLHQPVLSCRPDMSTVPAALRAKGWSEVRLAHWACGGSVKPAVLRHMLDKTLLTGTNTLWHLNQHHHGCLVCWPVPPECVHAPSALQFTLSAVWYQFKSAKRIPPHASTLYAGQGLCCHHVAEEPQHILLPACRPT